MAVALLSSELPERFARLYDYETGKFETPLDNRGIADIDALFELAIRTFPDRLPSFTSSERNRHHIYWTEQAWKDLAAQHNQSDADTIHTFRNSTPQLAYVPPDIHAWIEESMIPPPAPPLEIMRRQNVSWSAATILLRSTMLLDKARTNYDTKKDLTRQVYGYIEGITPVSQRGEQLFEERVDREYWLSELENRLEGWRKISEVLRTIPVEDRLILEPRLASVRALERRIRYGAIVPKLPVEFLAA